MLTTIPRRANLLPPSVEQLLSKKESAARETFLDDFLVDQMDWSMVSATQTIALTRLAQLAICYKAPLAFSIGFFDKGKNKILTHQAIENSISTMNDCSINVPKAGVVRVKPDSTDRLLFAALDIGAQSTTQQKEARLQKLTDTLAVKAKNANADAENLPNHIRQPFIAAIAAMAEIKPVDGDSSEICFQKLSKINKIVEIFASSIERENVATVKLQKQQNRAHYLGLMQGIAEQELQVLEECRNQTLSAKAIIHRIHFSLVEKYNARPDEDKRRQFVEDCSVLAAVPEVRTLVCRTLKDSYPESWSQVYLELPPQLRTEHDNYILFLASKTKDSEGCSVDEIKTLFKDHTPQSVRSKMLELLPEPVALRLYKKVSDIRRSSRRNILPLPNARKRKFVKEQALKVGKKPVVNRTIEQAASLLDAECGRESYLIMHQWIPKDGANRYPGQDRFTKEELLHAATRRLSRAELASLNFNHAIQSLVAWGVLDRISSVFGLRENEPNKNCPESAKILHKLLSQSRR